MVNFQTMKARECHVLLIYVQHFYILMFVYCCVFMVRNKGSLKMKQIGIFQDIFFVQTFSCSTEVLMKEWFFRFLFGLWTVHFKHPSLNLRHSVIYGISISFSCSFIRNSCTNKVIMFGNYLTKRNFIPISYNLIEVKQIEFLHGKSLLPKKSEKWLWQLLS